MDLKNLAPVDGSRRPRKRVGRGNGSGLGKTCGRGHKGQNSRSGGGVRPGFEGGQMPLHRRLPKRGFSNYPFRKRYALVNIRDLVGFAADTVVDPQALMDAGLVRKLYDGVKILGEGDLGVALTIRAHRFSKSAVAKIEAAGGKTETVGRKPSTEE
jgi:large subunit ribosomal protein L15